MLRRNFLYMLGASVPLSVGCESLSAIYAASTVSRKPKLVPPVDDAKVHRLHKEVKVAATVDEEAVYRAQPIISYILAHYAYMKPTFRFFIVNGLGVLKVSIYGGAESTRFVDMGMRDGKISDTQRLNIDYSMRDTSRRVVATINSMEVHHAQR